MNESCEICNKLVNPEGELNWKDPSEWLSKNDLRDEYLHFGFSESIGCYRCSSCNKVWAVGYSRHLEKYDYDLLSPEIVSKCAKNENLSTQMKLLESPEYENLDILRSILGKKIDRAPLEDLEGAWPTLLKGLKNPKMTDWARKESVNLLYRITNQLSHVLERHDRVGPDDSGPETIQIKIPEQENMNRIIREMEYQLAKQVKTAQYIIDTANNYFRQLDFLRKKYEITEGSEFLLRATHKRVKSDFIEKKPIKNNLSLAILFLLGCEVIAAIALIFWVDMGSVFNAIITAIILGGAWLGIHGKWYPHHFQRKRTVILLGILLALIPILFAHYVGYRSIVSSGSPPPAGMTPEEKLVSDVNMEYQRSVQSPLVASLIYRSEKGYVGYAPRKIGKAKYHRKGLEMRLCWLAQLILFPWISIAVFYFPSKSKFIGRSK